MRISVVADVHGNIEALARVADTAEQLIILGDLLDYVDYHDPERGILGEIFGVDAVLRFTALRSAGAFGELRRYNAALWNSLADPEGVLAGRVRARYSQVLDAVPDSTLVTLGNVDVVAEWNRVAGDRLPYRDAEALDIDGVRFGFVAGGVRRGAASETIELHGRAPEVDRRPWRPFIRDAAEYTRAVEALGPVDVLCSHIPPEMALLRYDVVPGRFEMAGPGLTDHIDRFRPLLALFGHVHQPLASRSRRGHTECVNVGHFQRTGRALVVDTEWIRAAARSSVTPRMAETAALAPR